MQALTATTYRSMSYKIAIQKNQARIELLENTIDLTGFESGPSRTKNARELPTESRSPLIHLMFSNLNSWIKVSLN
jgi:hypothetical protein